MKFCDCHWETTGEDLAGFVGDQTDVHSLGEMCEIMKGAWKLHKVRA